MCGTKEIISLSSEKNPEKNIAKEVMKSPICFAFLYTYMLNKFLKNITRKGSISVIKWA